MYDDVELSFVHYVEMVPFLALQSNSAVCINILQAVCCQNMLGQAQSVAVAMGYAVLQHRLLVATHIAVQAQSTAA